MRLTNFALLEENEVNIPKADLSTNAPVLDGLQILFTIIAAVSLLLIVISALKMILSRGNPEAFTKARDSVIYSVVGLVIAMAAFIIVTFVVERV